jgi:hypothetical protein
VELGNQYAERPIGLLLVRRLGAVDEFQEHERTRSLGCVEQPDRVAVGQRADRRCRQSASDQMGRKPCLPTDFVRVASAVPVELEDVAGVGRGQFEHVVHQGAE